MSHRSSNSDISFRGNTRPSGSRGYSNNSGSRGYSNNSGSGRSGQVARRGGTPNIRGAPGQTTFLARTINVNIRNNYGPPGSSAPHGYANSSGPSEFSVAAGPTGSGQMVAFASTPNTQGVPGQAVFCARTINVNVENHYDSGYQYSSSQYKY